MTTITINRVVLEGTLEALRELLPDEGDSNCGGYDARDVRQWRATAKTLQSVLHQQPAQHPVAYTTGHCENHKQKGGCQLHNLQCGWPDCDRKPTTAPPNQAESRNQCGETCERAKLCATCARALDQQQEPVAWMYKAEPWFDGRVWHETYETTTDKTLAYFKDKNARALCFVEK